MPSSFARQGTNALVLFQGAAALASVLENFGSPHEAPSHCSTGLGSDDAISISFIITGDAYHMLPILTTSASYTGSQGQDTTFPSAQMSAPRVSAVGQRSHGSMVVENVTCLCGDVGMSMLALAVAGVRYQAASTRNASARPCEPTTHEPQKWG